MYAFVVGNILFGRMYYTLLFYILMQRTNILYIHRYISLFRETWILKEYATVSQFLSKISFFSHHSYLNDAALVFSQFFFSNMYTPWTGLSDLLTFFDPRKPFRSLLICHPSTTKMNKPLKGH